MFCDSAAVCRRLLQRGLCLWAVFWAHLFCVLTPVLSRFCCKRVVPSESCRAQWPHQCEVSFQDLLPFLKLCKAMTPLKQTWGYSSCCSWQFRRGKEQSQKPLCLSKLLTDLYDILASETWRYWHECVQAWALCTFHSLLKQFCAPQEKVTG